MSRNNLQVSRSRRISKACFELLEDRKLLSFAAAANYPVGTNPQDIVSADFNGDGKLDLATANKGSSNVSVLPGSVSVLLGNGTGGFGAATPFATGRLPNSLAVADFNGDAKLDLVAGCDLDPYILLGKGDGTFQSAVRVGPGFYTVLDVAVGDFNGDHKTDLVVSEQDDLTGVGGAVWVLRGNGLGGFMSPLGVGVSPSYGLTVADVNRDGKLDAVTTGYTMLGNGDGTLREAVQNLAFSFNPDQLPRASTIAEMTGDGVPDLVIASDKVEVVGAGVIFHPAVDFFYTAVATGDFNADGKLDAVATYSNADLWLGNGDGTLRDPVSFATGSSPAAVAVGDFNRDGRPDAAVANGGSNNVSVLLNDGNWATASKTFVGPGGAGSGGNWSNASNWSPGGVPAANDQVVIGGGRTVNLSADAIAGGVSLTGGATLNLNDKALVVNHNGSTSPIGSWNGSAYTGVTGLIRSGRNGGAWNSNGITSSTAAANPTRYALGVADASQVLVKVTYAGDANLDGKLNIDDFVKIDLGIAAGVTGWSNGDFNYDGKINVDDYVIIDGNIDNQGPPFSNSASIDSAEMAASAWVGQLEIVWDFGTEPRDTIELLSPSHGSLL